jgi:DNA primase
VRFSQDFIDKVRDANNIVEIIGQYTELKGTGSRLTGRCPFPDHTDKSPSFSVTEDNQLYFCYGCKKGGNVFTFLEIYNGQSFPEAVEFLAKRAGIQLPEPESQRGKDLAQSGPSKREQRDILLKVNRLAGIYFHQNLKAQTSDGIAVKYLQQRGLSSEISEKFRLGYAEDDWQGLAHYFFNKQVPANLAESVGLIKAKKAGVKGDSHFDLFRNRLMFPIFSATGDVVGFGGRTLGEDIAKYVNSSDSPVFHKGRVLYGLHETGKFIRAQDEAIVVEGYMDALALYSAGIKNVVAILGTAFTPDHAKLLKRYSLNVKMLLDGDEAGINGAERSLPILLEAGLRAKGFVLPNNLDPDDFIKAQGAERLKFEIERAPELFSLLLMRRWMKDYQGSSSDKVRILEEASAVLRGLKNPQLMDLYIFELSRQLDVDSNWVRRSINQINSQAGSTTLSRPTSVAASPSVAAEAESADQSRHSASIEIETVSVKGAPRDEAFILSLLLHNESLMRELEEVGAEELLNILSHEGVRRILSIAIEKYRQKPDSFAILAASLASQIDLPEIITSSLELTRGMADETKREQDQRNLMGDYLNAIRKRFLQKQAKALANQIRDQATPETLEQFMNIQRDRLSLNRD